METTQHPQFTIDVHLTDVAAEQVRGFLAQEGVPAETGGLRVSVMPGGCSGFKYGLNIEDAPADDDIVLAVQGIRVFVDAFSAQYLNGAEIDYIADVMKSGFSIFNPIAVKSCACGSSFQTGDNAGQARPCC